MYLQVGAQNSQAIEVFRILRPWKIHNNPRGLPQTPPNKQSWNTTNTQTNASCFFGQNSHQKNCHTLASTFFIPSPKQIRPISWSMWSLTIVGYSSWTTLYPTINEKNPRSQKLSQKPLPKAACLQQKYRIPRFPTASLNTSSPLPFKLCGIRAVYCLDHLRHEVRGGWFRSTPKGQNPMVKCI